MPSSEILATSFPPTSPIYARVIQQAKRPAYMHARRLTAAHEAERAGRWVRINETPLVHVKSSLSLSLARVARSQAAFDYLRTRRYWLARGTIIYIYIYIYIYIGALYCTRAQISFFRAAPLKLEKKRRKKKKKRSCLSLWHSTALLYRFVCVLSFSRARLLNLRVYWFPEPGLYIEQLAPIFSAYRELLSSEACVYIIYACLDLSRIYKCLYAQAWEFYCVLCDAWKWKESERVFERGQENCWEWPAERYI